MEIFVEVFLQYSIKYFASIKVSIYLCKNMIMHMFHFLILVPSGKPIITSAHNTSATSIYLAWKAPSPDTIHGEFLGYRIGYKPRDKPYMEEKEVYIRNPAIDVSWINICSNIFYYPCCIWFYIDILRLINFRTFHCRIIQSAICRRTPNTWCHYRFSTRKDMVLQPPSL